MPKIAVNGTNLHYLDEGPPDAPPILFGHSLFFSSEMFHKQAAALSGEFRVIRYDHRGQGESDPAPREQLDMDTLTDDAAALIEGLAIAPCHYVGNSMGGFIAARLAARRPDLLRSATLIGSSADEEHKLADFEPLVEAMAEGMEPLVETVMFIMFGDAFLADPERSEEREKYAAAIAALAPRIGDAAHGVIHRKRCLEELEGCQVPLLVLAGEQDHAYEVPLSRAIADTAPNARMEILPAAGHSGALEAPDLVNDELRKLIAQTEAAGAAA